ncbi:MAG TPA: alpha/beta hydrolase [Nocardioidaceae bacterium]|nr:alpha/beta hydrolase [Nocardioidaceae bacterium]
MLELMDELDLRDAVYVGHSVSSMIGVLAATRDPSRFGALVLVGPSQRYLNDVDYRGRPAGSPARPTVVVLRLPGTSGSLQVKRLCKPRVIVSLQGVTQWPSPPSG